MDTLNFNSPEAHNQLRNADKPQPNATVPAGNQPPMNKGGRFAPDNYVNPMQPNAASPRQQGGAPVPPPPPARNPQPQQRRPAPQTGSNNTAQRVGIGLGAAAVAAGATAATMSAFDGGEATDDAMIAEAGNSMLDAVAEIVTPEEEVATETTAAAAAPAATATPAAPAAPEIPEPVPTPVTPEEPIIPDPEEPEFPEQPLEPFEPTDIQDPEDIDAIADAIIAQDQIDSDDIAPDINFAFNDMDTVYTVDGDIQTMASFTDTYGNDLVMVDIDNDGLFDRIETPDGFYIADAEDYRVAVSDAQLMTTEPEGYLAQDDTEIDTFDQTLGDDYLDDIIEV